MESGADEERLMHESVVESEYSEVRLDEPDQPDQLYDDEEVDDKEPRVTIHENNSQSVVGKEKETSRNYVNEKDSPCVQTSGSMTTNNTMVIRTDTTNEDKSISGSSASSPIPASPHKTRFSVTIRHAKECTGDIITYLVSSKRLFDDKGSGGEGKVYQVHRVYEDFEFLHQCLIMAAFAGQCMSIMIDVTKSSNHLFLQ